jgi:hypothetical protein
MYPGRAFAAKFSGSIPSPGIGGIRRIGTDSYRGFTQTKDRLGRGFNWLQRDR